MKGVSTFAIILIMIISATVGGLISYMFTIAFFITIPEDTTVTITSVYFNKENAASFKIRVLNPSYSPGNATITRIAVSLQGGSQLYDVVQTEPSIENGIVVPKGEALNITCFRAQKDSVDVSWGRLASEFAGENITVHVFSPDSPAANIETSLPLVKLHIIDTTFDSETSFERFNITIMSELNSELNLTISAIMVAGIDLTEDDVSPRLPQVITAGEHIQFACNKSWHGISTTKVTVLTEEGYVCIKELELPRIFTEIQNVTFNENHTDYFNITVLNSAESANYVNVADITSTLENGTTIQRNYPSVKITPNSTHTFKFDWTWKEYRGKKINVTAHLSQDLETNTFTAVTSPPVIFTVLNEKEVFDLKDRNHFTITLRNHPSSIEIVNITEIIVDSEEINGTEADPMIPYGPIGPGQTETFYCNITDWTDQAGKDMVLIVHAMNEASEEHTFEFTFTLPMAELNITSLKHTSISGTKYLNVTVENVNYSVRNLTILKAIISLQSQSEPLEQVFPENQIVVKPGAKVILLCAFNWEEYLGANITVIVISEEGVEVSWQGTYW